MFEDVVKMPFSCSAATVGVAAFTAYVGFLQLLRFRRVRAMKLLDVKTDPSAVFRRTFLLEFPFMVTMALEFAQFRGFGVPSISKLLHKTGEFCKRSGKRFDDTDLLFREFHENHTELNRSKIAVARINAIHDPYSKKISNADMLYTICLFITEPPAWIDRYEWRRCTDIEKEAILGHFVLLGERLGVKGVRDWKTWDDAVAFQRAYEAKHYVFHESNNAVAVPTIDLFISNVPKCLRWAARWAAYSLMDPFLLKTMGLPQVPTLCRWAVTGTLLVRAMIVRFLVPPRPEILVCRRTPFIDDAAITPQFVMKPRYESYFDPKLGCLLRKDGYTLGELGPVGCPAGRLVHDPPSFTGDGGGGSGPVVLGADGEPLTAPDAVSAKKGN